MTYEMQLAQAAGLAPGPTGGGIPGPTNKPEGLQKIHGMLRGRYPWIISLGLLLGAIGGVWGYYAPTVPFRSEGVIEINPDILSITNGPNMGIPDYPTFLNKQIMTLADRQNIRDIMDAPVFFDPDEQSRTNGKSSWFSFSHFFPQVTLDQFISNFDAESRPGTDLIRVTYTATTRLAAWRAVCAACRWFNQNGDAADPLRLGYRIKQLHNQIDALDNGANAVSEITRRIHIANEKYNTQNLTGHLQQKESALAHELQELDDAEVDLAGTMAQMGYSREQVKYTLESPAAGPTADDREAALPAKRATTQTGDTQAAASSQPAAVAVSYYFNLPPDPPSIAAPAQDDPRVRSYQDLKESKEKDMERLKMKGFGENHPQITSLQQEIDWITQQIEIAKSSPVVAAVHNTQGDLQLRLNRADTLYGLCRRSEAELKIIRNDVYAVQIDQALLDGKNAQIQDLQHSLAQMELTLTMNTKSRIDPDEKNPDKIMEFGFTHGPASEPLDPSFAQPANDTRRKIAAMGFLGGAILPVFVFLIIGFSDNRFRYSDEAHTSQLAGIPLLGILPNLPDLLTDPQQAATAAHCVHQIRTLLQITGHGSDRRAFAVTSGSPGDGKTSLALALGLSFAASGSKTLLIDGDLIGGGLTSRLNIHSDHGVMEALASKDATAFVRGTDVSGLSILPIGQAMGPYSGAIAPAAVRRMVTVLRDQFDIIIIDTGPILGSIEASPIAVAVDGVVLCVSRGQQRQLVDRALAHLQAIGAKLAGVVFNRAQAQDFERSVSRVSMKPLPNEGNTNGNRSERIGPVARAVASSVRSTTSDAKVSKSSNGSH